jgi:signal transduction histidine kinase
LTQPLRRQIFLTVVIVAILVYAAIGYGAKLTYDQHLLQLAAETRTMASTVAVYINRNLETADAVAATASRHPGLRALDPSAAAEVLSPLLTPEGLLHNALLADAEGRPIAWARPPDATVEALIDAAWLKRVIDQRAMQISPMLGQAGNGVHAIVLGYPIVSDSGVIGMLGLSVHLEALERVLASIPLPAGSVVTLTDPDGVVVARSLDAAQYVGRSAAPGGRARNPSDVPVSAVLTGVDGVPRVFGNAVVERGPWLVSVGIPTSVALDRTWPIYRRNLLISILTSFVILALTWWVGRRWLQSFDHLDATARRISRGDLSPLQQKPMPSAEMEQLQQTVASMITSLQRARESIASQVDDERRIREELQSLQQQVIRQERLAAIGVLVSGVAHELNNPLQAILGFAELLQMQKDIPQQARADLTLIQKESARASAIIRNLQRFGRQMAEPSPVRLRDVITSVLELRQRKMQEANISVAVEDNSRGVVMAIFTELQQVVLNFAINAEQAIVAAQPETRTITFRTGDRDGWSWIEVEDTGRGVPPADEAKLFQPFYTTKPVNEGTGLGLSVSYDIIRSHHGRIGYRRSSSGGAVFFFELPAAPDEIASS